MDLHPVGFDRSYAYGVAGASQVGWGSGPATGGLAHALLWNGAAASALDLHPYLTGLGPNFTTSVANGIADDGTIVGTAYDGGSGYAVLWSPIPESNAATLACCGMIAVALIRRRRL
jgi:hypothetical protein